MRVALLALWLLLPFGAWAYHEGPGQERMQLDEVDEQLARAESAAADEDWAAAITAYEAALESLPAGEARASRSIRLALNQARMQHQQLPLARRELAQLVADLVEDEAADPALLEKARTALASAQYYITWLMRLEGYPREEWEPEVEAARQTYRLLAEQAENSGDEATAKRRSEDLESTVMLARMDLQELQGLPLPNE